MTSEKNSILSRGGEHSYPESLCSNNKMQNITVLNEDEAEIKGDMFESII